MTRSMFAKEQIIAALREREAGLSTVEVRRRHGTSTATFSDLKAKFGGMGPRRSGLNSSRTRTPS